MWIWNKLVGYSDPHCTLNCTNWVSALTFEIFDKAVFLSHLLSRESETDSDSGQKSFGNICNSDADKKDHGLNQVVPDGHGNDKKCDTYKIKIIYISVKYNGNLNTGLVWYLNIQKEVGCQMVQNSNAIFNAGQNEAHLFSYVLVRYLNGQCSKQDKAPKHID